MKLRKGFTLVELLIVIVIIGILAGAMMLASGAATASAEASNVVSNLRSLQSASLMLFADHMTPLQDPANPAVAGVTIGSGGTGNAAGDALTLLTRYTANPESEGWNQYGFHLVGTGAYASRSWWVSAPVISSAVQTRLQSRRDIGLYVAAVSPVGAPNFGNNAWTPTTNVYLLIRNPAAL